MTAAPANDVDRLTDAISKRRTAEATWPPPPPGGWDHLPVSLVDTTFSLQAQYSRDGEVFPAVAKYARFAEVELGLTEGTLTAPVQEPPREPTHSLSEMVELLAPLSTADRVDLFGSNRPAHTRPGAPRRADTVVEAARKVSELGVETRADFAQSYRDDDRRSALHAAWTSVPGFAKRAWEYIPLLCGLPAVKADTHVTGFVSSALDRRIAPEEARDLVIAATEQLAANDPQPGWSTGGVEHFIWRVQSGQEPR